MAEGKLALSTKSSYAEQKGWMNGVSGDTMWLCAGSEYPNKQNLTNDGVDIASELLIIEPHC